MKTASAFLACLLLTACGSLYKTSPGTSVLVVKPPAELTEPVAEPQLPEAPTNGDLAEVFDQMRAALREANRRLRAIRSL